MPLYHAEYQVEQLKDPDTRWLVSTEGGQAVGVAMWRMIPGLAHLHMLFVSSDYHGHGHGMRLLKHHQTEALKEAKDTKLFTLHCLRESTWAIRFYKHHGYTEYQDGDEHRVTDLYVWIDACRRHDNGWPLRADKALFYKKAH